MQQDVFMCFIDYEKGFDRVKHDRLGALLRNIGLDGKDLRIVRNLYYNQKATVRIEGEVSKEVDRKEFDKAVFCLLCFLIYIRRQSWQHWTT
ncbi:jg13114 [Pararge aegeria aegeria]|uniref:Jg13114 protein n=1 Tax=Pararge aegeria aegeria TaxID=348720 RepID=A0A8S4R8N1_9NEOP|nr:jg13114 [Pararge aegeria aegeria]